MGTSLAMDRVASRAKWRKRWEKWKTITIVAVVMGIAVPCFLLFFDPSNGVLTSQNLLGSQDVFLYCESGESSSLEEEPSAWEVESGVNDSGRSILVTVTWTEAMSLMPRIPVIQFRTACWTC